MENKKVYIVYQLGYDGTNILEILGVYDTYDKAEKVYLQNINDNIEDYDYCVDEECNDRIYELIHRMTRLFKGDYQENWDNYLEIHIEEQEVK